MEVTNLINEVVDNAKAAYTYAKETGFEKPLVETSKSFIISTIYRSFASIGHMSPLAR